MSPVEFWTLLGQELFLIALLPALMLTSALVWVRQFRNRPPQD